MNRPKTKGKKVKAKPLPLEVTSEEYIKLLENTKHMRHKVAFMLAFESGLRISEVINLRPEDFNYQHQTIRVNEGKFSKDRIVNMPICWEDRFMKYIPIKCQQRALQKAFIRSAELSGMKYAKPKIHFHNLRHGYATENLRAGVKLEQIRIMMGHEDISTTMIYAHMAPEDALRSVRTKFGTRQYV